MLLPKQPSNWFLIFYVRMLFKLGYVHSLWYLYCPEAALCDIHWVRHPCMCSKGLPSALPVLQGEFSAVNRWHAHLDSTPQLPKIPSCPHCTKLTNTSQSCNSPHKPNSKGFLGLHFPAFFSCFLGSNNTGTVQAFYDFVTLYILFLWPIRSIGLCLTKHFSLFKTYVKWELLLKPSPDPQDTSIWNSNNTSFLLLIQG